SAVPTSSTAAATTAATSGTDQRGTRRRAGAAPGTVDRADAADAPRRGTSEVRYVVVGVVDMTLLLRHATVPRGSRDRGRGRRGADAPTFAVARRRPHRPEGVGRPDPGRSPTLPPDRDPRPCAMVPRDAAPQRPEQDHTDRLPTARPTPRPRAGRRPP